MPERSRGGAFYASVSGFCETARRPAHQKPSYLPKTWKPAGNRTVMDEVVRNVTEAIYEVPADDLDVPTFLRRQAQ